MAWILGSVERRKVSESVVALHSCALLTLLAIPPVMAEEYVVRTRSAQWVPAVLFIQPGDTVVWHRMAGHETELIEGMGPEDTTFWRSELHDEGFSVTLDLEGAYVYKCQIHLGVGMVATIVVGDSEPHNLAAIDAALATIEDGRDVVERAIMRMKRALRRRASQAAAQ